MGTSDFNVSISGLTETQKNFPHSTHFWMAGIRTTRIGPSVFVGVLPIADLALRKSNLSKPDLSGNSYRTERTGPPNDPLFGNIFSKNLTPFGTAKLLFGRTYIEIRTSMARFGWFGFTPPKPNSPILTVSNVTETTVDLFWSTEGGTSNQDSFKIIVTNVTRGVVKDVIVKNIISKGFINLKIGESYSIGIVAIKDGIESDLSNIIAFTTLGGTVPPPPEPEPQILSRNFEVVFTDLPLDNFTSSLSPSSFTVLENLSKSTDVWAIIPGKDSTKEPKTTFQEIIDFINLILVGLPGPKPTEGLSTGEKVVIVAGAVSVAGLALAAVFTKKS